LFDISDKIELKSKFDSFKSKTKAFELLANLAFEKGIVSSFMQEPYPVVEAPNTPPLAYADRNISTLLGLISFGQHINGYVKDGNSLKMWIGRRSYNKGYEPGKLDHIAAGGLPANIDFRENLIKECQEEASIPKEIAIRAKSVGYVSYKMELDNGGKLDYIYCYDLELPKDFVPKNSDGEMEEFFLLNIKEVDDIIKNSFDFKSNCALVIIDFLIRHGYIKESHPEFLKLVKELRR